MSASVPPEVHVAGVVVHAYPEAVARVVSAVETHAGARVHAQSRDGKLVVTLEADDADTIAAAIVEINRIEGVLAASLVYQHAESASSMDEEVKS